MKLDRIKDIYEELEKYVIQLHPDPRTLGPQYLNDQIATTRNYLNAVSRIQLEVHREKQYLSREIRAHEAALQVSSDDLLANDERVRRLPSIEDRKATVSVFLRAEKQAIENFKATLLDVEFVEKAVKHRHKELTNTMSEIKLQRSLIRDEIDTGAMYGDERTYGSASPGKGRAYVNPLGDDLSEEELARLLEGKPSEPPPMPAQDVVGGVMEAEVILPPPALTGTVEPPTDPGKAADEQKIAAFLGDSVDSGDLDDEYTKIFDGI